MTATPIQIKPTSPSQRKFPEKETQCSFQDVIEANWQNPGK